MSYRLATLVKYRVLVGVGSLGTKQLSGIRLVPNEFYNLSYNMMLYFKISFLKFSNILRFLWVSYLKIMNYYFDVYCSGFYPFHISILSHYSILYYSIYHNSLLQCYKNSCFEYLIPNIQHYPKKI